MVVWDAGKSYERLAAQTGLHNEGRSEANGPEQEGLAITARSVAGGWRWVASERSNFVAVYDLSDITAPKFVQILPTAPGPEGVVPESAGDRLGTR